MRNTLRFVLSVLAVTLPTCIAQNPTATCDPLSASSCTPDTALNSPSFDTTWTSSSSLGNGWSTTAGSVSFDSSGAKFVINKEGDAPTIQTDFYIFYGYVEVAMQAASGTGIVSSIVMLSDVDDEIDWEFTGGDTTQTQTNYFGKGFTGTFNRAVWFPVASPQTQVHTYAVNWTSTAITWLIDGTAVRTLNFADADGGTHFPQTPMRVKLGIWAGGDPSNAQGTIEWAGGPTDFSQAPFTMTVQSVKIQNYSPGSAYLYKDESGSSGSIEVEAGSVNSNGGEFAASGSSSAAGSSSPATTATTPAATTKPTATSTSSITVKGSTATSALSTIPLAAVSSSTGGSSSSSASTTGTSSSASGSAGAGKIGSASGSTTGGTSSALRSASSENALGALVLFFLVTLCMV